MTVSEATTADPGETPRAGEARDVSRARSAVRSLAELLGLTSLAMAQPLLDSFGRAPEVFSARDAGPLDIVIFALVVAFVPPLALWAVEQLVALIDRRAGRVVHLALVGGLGAAIVVVWARRADVTATVLVAAGAVALGAGLVVLHRRRWMRQWLAVLAVMPVLFVTVFLTGTATAQLVREPEPVVVAANEDLAPPQRSAVLVVFDEFPLDVIVDGEGAIDAELFPNLAALAADGAWFRNATTVATVTSVAVPAMLTGRYPSDNRAPVAVDHPENLFTLLGDRYDLRVEEQVTSLCPRALCDPVPPADLAGTEASSPSALGELVVEASTAWWHLLVRPDAVGPAAITEDVTAEPASAVDAARADDIAAGGAPVYRVDAFDDLLASIRAEEDPTLHFLHLQLPHAPYRFLPNGQAYQSEDADGGLLADVGNRGPDPYETTATRQRLILQAGYVDELVGQLTDRLREEGLYDDTVLVVTSDHGVGLVPDAGKRPLFDQDVEPVLYADLLWVPMLVKGPGLEPGTVDDRNAMIIDVLPTIADLLGEPIPWDVDGLSLAGRAKRLNNFKLFNRTTTNDSGDAADAFDVAILPARYVDGNTYFPQMLTRNVDALVRGDHPDFPLYDLVEGGELIGLPAGPLLVDRPTGLEAEVPGLGALADYADDDEYVPVRFLGELRGAPTTDPLTLVVTVDGVVAGVAPTTRSLDVSHRIDVMLPPELVPPGRHEVGLYVLDGPEGARSLWPVALR